MRAGRREDHTHMVIMAKDDRLIRVWPANWQSGFYEIRTSPGLADIITAYQPGWMEIARRFEDIERRTA